MTTPPIKTSEDRVLESTAFKQTAARNPHVGRLLAALLAVGGSAALVMPDSPLNFLRNSTPEGDEQLV